MGCGRCITWCPAGIDLTAEVAALREDATHRETTPASAALAARRHRAHGPVRRRHAPRHAPDPSTDR